MSEKELERILHKLGRSSMNAGNILAMTKHVLDEHSGQVPADWDAIIKFHDLQSTLGGAGTMHQLPNAKKILKVGCLKSTEMDRMRMGLINPKFDMVRFLKDYVRVWEYSRIKR
eukprot:scaffold152771_cov93-Attheya_sp.AAC.1